MAGKMPAVHPCRDKPLDWVTISGWREGEGGERPGEAVLAISAHFSQDEERAGTLEFSGSMGLFAGGVSATTQAQAVALLQETFLEAEGVTGYLTVDYVSAAPGRKYKHPVDQPAGGSGICRT